MASPQAENGHVDIANEIVEALSKIRLSGEESQCLWVIFRKTYGWKKLEDKIALSQFAVMTGMKKQAVHRALQKLSSKMMIVIIKNDDGRINSFRFNKNFDKWIPSSKKTTPSSILIKGVNNFDKAPSSKMMNTKETTTKDTITKEIKTIVPHQEIVSLYHEILPELPAIKEWTETRKKNLQSRWREKEERQNIEWWRGFFISVKESDFLMGRSNDFRADLEWLILPKNFVKVMEGRYVNRGSGNGKKSLFEKNIEAGKRWLGRKEENEAV